MSTQAHTRLAQFTANANASLSPNLNRQARIAFLHLKQVNDAMTTALLAHKAHMPAIAARYKAQAIELALTLSDSKVREHVFTQLKVVRDHSPVAR